MSAERITDLVLDVDGVLTTGQFVYTSEGKVAKIFGPHDSDGIKLAKKHVSVSVISADERGYEITKKRVVEDMGLPLSLVPEADRLVWMRAHHDLSRTVFMGDGMHDAPILKAVAYGIAPANAFSSARSSAHYVTHARSGEGAVAEACLHILEKFFDVNVIFEASAEKA